MTQKFLILAFCFVLLACSNDDNNGPDVPQELNIKKFTITGVDANGTPDGNSTEYLFNEDATISQKKEDEATSDYSLVFTYSYNQLGQLAEINRAYIGVNANRALGYVYDSANKLDYITESYDGATPDIYFQLDHDPNKISITHKSPGFYTTLNFNNNTLTSVENEFDLGGYSTEDLTYDASSNILERPKVMGSGIYGEPEHFVENSYRYDDKTNPLYPSFDDNSLNLLGQYWFNLDHWKPFFSPNNFISESYTNTLSPEDNFTLTRTFQYNPDGYPISAEVKKNGVLIEKLSYEYY